MIQANTGHPGQIRLAGNRRLMLRMVACHVKSIPIEEPWVGGSRSESGYPALESEAFTAHGGLG